MEYSEAQAAAYHELGSKGSTYEVSLGAALASMGDLRGKLVLDFGSGTGRTAQLLSEAGAGHVVGVDKDRNMLRLATRRRGVCYVQIGNVIPIATESMDAALCANVFCEYSSIDQVTASCHEIARVLRPRSIFVTVVPNPLSVTCDYLNYRYLTSADVKRGAEIICLLKGSTQTLLHDYLWSQEDYLMAIDLGGFEVESVAAPLAVESESWLDESRVAPDLVVRAIKVR